MVAGRSTGSLDRMDSDALLAIADDLNYLGQWGPEIGDGEIRRGSAVLRRLLVEDAYGVAWRQVGKSKQPRVIAVDLLKMIGGIPSTDIEFALAAGANFRGVQMAGFLMKKGAHRPTGVSPPIRPGGYPDERVFDLSEYLSALSGVATGHSFTRRDVIKYIANVKGGVHLSAKQRKSEEKLIARVGKIEKRIAVHNTDGLLVELVAIGQAVGNSADAKEFIAIVKHAI